MVDNDSKAISVVEGERLPALAFQTNLVDQALTTGSEIARIFRERMKEKVHFMHFSGGSKPGLMDPGATMVQEGFNCYPVHKVLERYEDTDGHVRYVVQALLVHRLSGRTVAGGVGSCSSREGKYAYRWVTFEELPVGVDPESAKTKEDKGVTKYRVSNPELGELENTLLKMAAKRAEVDATLHLPGAGEIFTQDVEGGETRQRAPQVPCNTCGAPTFLFKDSKTRGHKTPDGQWHRQPITKGETEHTGGAPAPVSPTSPEQEGKPETLSSQPGAPPIPAFKSWSDFLVWTNERYRLKDMNAVRDVFEAADVLLPSGVNQQAEALVKIMEAKVLNG